MKNFFRDAIYLARTDAWRLLRNRETMLWTFIMPVIFFYFIGLVNNPGTPEGEEPLAVLSAPDAGFLADEILHRLAAGGFRIQPTRNRAELLTWRRRLELPAGFTASVLAGTPMSVHFSRLGDDRGADYDRVRVTRAVQTVLADLVVIRMDGTIPSPEQFRKLAAEPRTLQLDVKPAGKRLIPPSGYEQSVPGTMVMFTLTVLFTAGAVSLTLERTNGILRRLAYSPMSRGAVVLGKWGGRMAIGCLQISIAMLTGTVLFGVHWGPNLPMVALVMLSYASLAASLAMLLGNYGRSFAQVIGLGVTISNLLAGLGGCWWPVEITPLWTRKLALFLPTGWTMDALHKLVTFGAPPASVLPHICVSFALALLAGFIIARNFRFQ